MLEEHKEGRWGLPHQNRVSKKREGPVKRLFIGNMVCVCVFVCVWMYKAKMFGAA